MTGLDAMLGLFDRDGQRKYVCGTEGRRFLAAAARLDPDARAFCRLLAFSGCRVSEGLALTSRRLDPEAGCVIFQTLKRRKVTFRAVPVPASLMQELRQLAGDAQPDARIWTWCRQTAWRRVRHAMNAAGIVGVQATPKGLRHGFGILNAEQNVPASLTQRWMGHARSDTTAIYQQALGREERAFAQRLWKSLPPIQ